MFPIADENFSVERPYITYSLIIINIIIYAINFFTADSLNMIFAFVPKNFMEGIEPWTIITHQFMHGGWGHLLGNMWFLIIFGDNIEATIGKFKYLFFYLLCGMIAALSHMAFNLDSIIPTVGASGAISGVLGAYIILYPKNKISTIIPFGFIRIYKVEALYYLVIWFVIQLLFSFTDPYGGVAYMAHLGGFFGGVLLIKLFVVKKKKTKNDSYYTWENQYDNT
ncbi:MAG: intramembrane serine protease GlpG [Candidatus Methanofastidiosum methylothiophilum]|uniref:Intramembrane serine protease GlpG n=1 Tax=Candidatus Methanofastidiosum methylothiophilum TaxID=1705564 RepID=A0A150IM05_9EURY|nr:MAG: intramembrane serine protease GlpG [Candidatus Methanofastidiosum methylthiophilus]KYC48187.1 MAG: intramembrane serine protease GlpG [Candidatus Methanofastidiosum methylthiophilus]KYC50842.1 MAG: intramembrane serine protease GlpG [Candidatus Methanofastidiosum methylthiophilus]